MFDSRQGESAEEEEEDEEEGQEPVKALRRVQLPQKWAGLPCSGSGHHKVGGAFIHVNQSPAEAAEDSAV